MEFDSPKVIHNWMFRKHGMLRKYVLEQMAKTTFKVST